jgi:hypothetical protein
MIQVDNDIKLGETLSGSVKDNCGNVHDICAYYGRFEFILATTRLGIPICCVARRVTDKFNVAWEDNDFRDIQLMQTVCGYADRGEFGKEFDIKDNKVKVVLHVGDLLIGINPKNGLLILCIGMKDDGEIINYWCDSNFRLSQSLDIYTDIAHGVAIARGWVAKDIKEFYAFVAVDNIYSVKYVTRVGCQLRGQIVSDGVKFNVYKYTAQSRIDRARETAINNGINLEV